MSSNPSIFKNLVARRLQLAIRGEDRDGIAAGFGDLMMESVRNQGRRRVEVDEIKMNAFLQGSLGFGDELARPGFWILVAF